MIFSIRLLNYFHPATLAVIGCIVGILLAYKNISIIYTIILFFLGFTLLCLDYLYRTNYYSKIALGFVFITLGYLRFCYLVDHYRSFQKVVTYHTAYHITGKIVAIQNLQHKKNNAFILFKVNELQPIHNIATKLNGNIVAIYTNLNKNTSLNPGDNISVYNIQFSPTKDSHQYYLYKEGICSTIFCHKLLYILHDKPAHSLARWLHNVSMALYNQLQAKLSSKTFSLFSTLFLGNKNNSYSNNFIKDRFKEWGISHYLARSGLHLVIFIMIWYLILQYLPCYWLLKQLFMIILILMYTLLTYPTISFERALLSFLLYKFCNILLFRTHMLHILTIITLGILLYNPFQLLFLDFQLSFLITYALLWFNYHQGIHSETLER